MSINENIIITFSEAVRNIDNTVLTDSNIDSHITLKLNNASGSNISFDASINTGKTVITLDPVNDLPASQTVYVAIGATLEDLADNPITDANTSFTTSSASSDTSISVGQNTSCAILDNGDVKCWGVNVYGQLGIDSTTTKGNVSGDMASLNAINLGTGRTATAIDLGFYHTCAILDNDDLKCWGRNNYGQLGIDSTTTKGRYLGDMASLDSIDL